MNKSRRVIRVLALLLILTVCVGVYAGAESEFATWNEVVDTMDAVLDNSYAAYESGDADAAFKGVNEAYYGYYETTGFERIVMGYISGSRKTEVELQFTNCKSAAKKGVPVEEYKEEIEKLKAMLREDANILDGTSSGSSESAGGTGSSVATFFACFGIILREGIEAILVVGAIIAYLVKSGNGSKLRPVYWGSVLAIVLSFVAAWLLNALKLANAAPQEIIEGVTALIAVVVLFWVSNWMVSKSESEAWSRYIEGKVQSGVQAGSMFALGFTAFLAVFREGAEVILFYQPLLADAESTAPVWGGFAVGCVVLVFIYLAIRYWSVRLPLKPFFLATSILMFIMSIAFLGSGIKELIEGDVIIMTPVSWVPSNPVLEVLGVYPCVQTLVPQLILLIITVITFVLQIKRNNRLKREAEEARANGQA
ncbi:MAG: FTR1 family iron permease [Clostridia bacterium]|nr:FTR1 family iron permease [Clostridia bacterium]